MPNIKIREIEYKFPIQKNLEFFNSIGQLQTLNNESIICYRVNFLIIQLLCGGYKISRLAPNSLYRESLFLPYYKYPIVITI